MKKYLRALICLTYTVLKFGFIKIFHFNGFNFTAYNLVSPFSEVEIGKNSFLKLGKMIRIRSGSKIRVRANSKIEIGNNSSLNHGCMIISHEKITIGENVQLGPNVLIYDHDHDFKAKNGLKELKYKTNPIEIGNNVWIGANAVILRGTRIGDNSVVAAGSVIRGKYPSNSIIVQKRPTSVIEIAGEVQ